MNLFLEELFLIFKRQREALKFADFTYIYGQMGAGKSTIARLVDYCLGGHYSEAEMTSALQNEFVSASLTLKVSTHTLTLTRQKSSIKLRANWRFGGDSFEVMIPSRRGEGEVLPGTGIEVLSDLLYMLSGHQPPKVRRSKQKEDSELARLSFRDLLWYCYLDQDSMDSSFFHLDADSDIHKRQKSRDVLRFLVGFHQERVSALEVALEQHRSERLKCEAGAEAIKQALTEAEIASELELYSIRRGLEAEIMQLEAAIQQSRAQLAQVRPHAMEALQIEARKLASRITEIEESSRDLREMIARDRAHKNELLSLSTRFRRSLSARAVLRGVEFVECPCCGQDLPDRESEHCKVCCQQLPDESARVANDEAEERDLDARVTELGDLIERHALALRRNERHLREIRSTKVDIDRELTRVATDYDSTYLANVLETEKSRAAKRQQLRDLERMELLVQRITELSDRVDKLLQEEQKLRKDLKQAREKAEQDTSNLARLKELFLDCLLRSKMPGFYPDDIVEMQPPNFLPEITSMGGGLTTTSYSNLGSGGKKTLFKCCFALAVHRLAAEIEAILPAFIIIDSPMKNISERENRQQFEGFYDMLYQLSQNELVGTQFIVIDKEEYAPSEGYSRGFSDRHMQPNARGIDPSENPFPPLIRYYQGK